MTDGFQTNLLTGFATLLNAASVGVWLTTGEFAPTDTGIVLKFIPQSPDSVIALSTYSVSDDPSLSDSVIGLQVWTRMAGTNGSPVDDLDDQIFDQLHGLHDVTLSTGVHVVQCLKRGGASQGQDDQHRWERSANYYVTVWRPSPNRI